MRQLDKCASVVNGKFTDRLGAAFAKQFGRELETSFDFLGSMALVSRPVDGGDFTPEQKAWVASYSDGYGEALGMIRALANGDAP